MAFSRANGPLGQTKTRHVMGHHQSLQLPGQFAVNKGPAERVSAKAVVHGNGGDGA